VLEIRSKVEGERVWSMLRHGHGIIQSGQARMFRPLLSDKGWARERASGLTICYGISRTGGKITVSSSLDVERLFTNICRCRARMPDAALIAAPMFWQVKSNGKHDRHSGGSPRIQAFEKSLESHA